VLVLENSLCRDPNRSRKQTGNKIIRERNDSSPQGKAHHIGLLCNKRASFCFAVLHGCGEERRQHAGGLLSFADKTPVLLAISNGHAIGCRLPAWREQRRGLPLLFKLG
jgi:hypothetical protein